MSQDHINTKEANQKKYLFKKLIIIFSYCLRSSFFLLQNYEPSHIEDIKNMTVQTTDSLETIGYVSDCLVEYMEVAQIGLFLGEKVGIGRFRLW